MNRTFSWLRTTMLCNSCLYTIAASLTQQFTHRPPTVFLLKAPILVVTVVYINSNTRRFNIIKSIVITCGGVQRDYCTYWKFEFIFTSIYGNRLFELVFRGKRSRLQYFDKLNILLTQWITMVSYYNYYRPRLNVYEQLLNGTQILFCS